MKPLALVLAALMTLFALVQLNDPDGLRWAALYAAVALALALAGLRPRWLRAAPARVALVALAALLAALLVLLWPEQAGFWRREVWWEEETAREGLGLAIALLATLVALPVAFGRRAARSAVESPAPAVGSGHAPEGPASGGSAGAGPGPDRPAADRPAADRSVAER